MKTTQKSVAKKSGGKYGWMPAYTTVELEPEGSDAQAKFADLLSHFDGDMDRVVNLLTNAANADAARNSIGFYRSALLTAEKRLAKRNISEKTHGDKYFTALHAFAEKVVEQRKAREAEEQAALDAALASA